MSWWGGREHFIAALGGALSEVCKYLDEWAGTSTEPGEEGSGVGEGDVDVVGEMGESCRERLGMAEGSRVIA